MDSDEDDDDFFSSDSQVFNDENLGHTPRNQSEKSDELLDDSNDCAGIDYKLFNSHECAYMRTDEFKKYFRANQFHVNPNYGYMHIALNNEYYFPGQIVRGRVYVQLVRTIRASQAVLKINGEKNCGIPTRQNLLVTPITKRQTFLEDRDPANNKRKKSVILEIPVINILKAYSDNKSESDSEKVRGKVRRPPQKHAKSEFICQADQELDDWIDQKHSENPSESAGYFIFRIIEPVFRIKNKELKPGLYCFPFSFRIPNEASGSFKCYWKNDKYYIRYYLSFNFHNFGDFKIVKDFDVREYLFTDEEVQNEYKIHEKVVNINELLDVKGKTLLYQPEIEEIKHEPDITHMLKGIQQTQNKIFDHNFRMKSCCWTEESNINISLSTNQALFYNDEKIDVKFFLETSKKVSNIVTIQCLLLQEVVIKKRDGDKPKKMIEFELAIQSKQPHLPKGISHAELEFNFDLAKIFKTMSEMVGQKFVNSKQASIKSQLSSFRETYEANISRAKTFEKKFINMSENLQELTQYSIRGNTIESMFFIKIEISLQRIIGGNEKKVHKFPILVRSRRLDKTQLSEYPKVPSIFEDAIQLPGANINIKPK